MSTEAASERAALDADVREFCSDVAAAVGRAETAAERDAAARRIAERAFPLDHLPGWAREGSRDAYARHLLHRCPDTGAVVRLLVWASGQASPIHDHGGACGVVHRLGGELTVTEFDLVTDERTASRAELREGATSLLDDATPTVTCGLGRDIHRIANRGTDTAYSLHVYSRDITDYYVFDLERRTCERRRFAG